MNVVCAWCSVEGRPDRIAQKPTEGHPTETHGICGPHHLELLLKTVPVESERDVAAAEFLVVVAKHGRQELSRVSELCLHDPRFRVLMDRREGERRRASDPPAVERRRGDRRRPLPYWNDLRYQRLIVIPLGKPEVPGSPPTAPPIDTTRLEAWRREGELVLGTLIPKLIQESRAQAQRIEAAEQRVRPLQQIVNELLTERAAVDETRRLIGQVVQGFQRGAQDLGQLARRLQGP